MTRKKKTATLVMANYNHVKYLPESLSSIFAQSRAIDEVIIIDDASTDNSLEVLSQFQVKEARLRVLRNETNKGAVYSANRGLAQASGDLVCFHSADDFMTPIFFEFSVGMLETCPIAGLCTSYFSHFRDSDRAAFLGKLAWADKPSYLSPTDLMRLKIGGTIPGHASVYDKQAVLRAGALIPELKWHCDWFMNHVIAARTGICFIPFALSFFRDSEGGSYSSGRSNWNEQKQVIANILKLLFSDEFKDVIPFFQGSATMSHLCQDVGRFLVEEATILTSDEILTVWQMLKETDRQQLMTVFDENRILVPELHQICSQYEAAPELQKAQ